MDSLSVIREFLQERLGVEAVKITSDALLDDLGVDSFMVLELMFEFEERFGITLARDLKTPRTVGEMAGLMDRLRGEHQS
ncbi:MAG: acyl carrier protein [Candidatus Accumulibacter phosphatis]|uniref:Acyl carrier protein n=2 Tax=Candidatus Accumulibacter TaxID=327159 RepID=A0A080M5J3_9PROT|nr:MULTISPECIES: acyl carrier protein [Candidatus Accumulibacter]KFB76503.1 MAG: Acyl carrier protein [Candidatus Accumulibacter cognatus]MBN8517212.1 acyl carrier protein [Accumulibacter sp.]MBO3712580.1 acyl carrier protein [Accumulibacter sp.]MCC2869788.1 acyl carrier protein [Candidatus Accumulibacter phosphatis]MCM8579733.1 acyl carrier protein [Accumulibacter sp.]